LVVLKRFSSKKNTDFEIIRANISEVIWEYLIIIGEYIVKVVKYLLNGYRRITDATQPQHRLGLKPPLPRLRVKYGNTGDRI
jgi:hypothetical protein